MSDYKRCPRCGQEKHRMDFNISRIRGDGLQAYCKICQRLNDSEYYSKNIKRRFDIRKNNRKTVAKVRKYVFDYLKDHPCVDCGESDPIVLQFDHVRGDKNFNIADAVSNNKCGLEKLKKEIEKCDIRCANCHLRKTAIEGNFWIINITDG